MSLGGLCARRDQAGSPVESTEVTSVIAVEMVGVDLRDADAGAPGEDREADRSESEPPPAISDMYARNAAAHASPETIPTSTQAEPEGRASSIECAPLPA